MDNFFTQLKPRERIIFLAAGILIFIAFMDRMILGPVLSQMNAMDSEISATKEKIRRDKRILNYRDSISQEYTRSSAYLDSNDQDHEEIISSLLNKIENLAKQQNITIKEIKPGDMEEKDIYQVYKTSMECEGTLNDVLAFMNMLEVSDYLFQITHYSLSPKSKDAQAVKASLDIVRNLITVESLPGLTPAESAVKEPL